MPWSGSRCGPDDFGGDRINPYHERVYVEFRTCHRLRSSRSLCEGRSCARAFRGNVRLRNQLPAFALARNDKRPRTRLLYPGAVSETLTNKRRAQRILYPSYYLSMAGDPPPPAFRHPGADFSASTPWWATLRGRLQQLSGWCGRQSTSAGGHRADFHGPASEIPVIRI